MFNNIIRSVQNLFRPAPQQSRAPSPPPQQSRAPVMQSRAPVQQSRAPVQQSRAPVINQTFQPNMSTPAGPGRAVTGGTVVQQGGKQVFIPTGTPIRPQSYSVSSPQPSRPSSGGGGGNISYGQQILSPEEEVEQTLGQAYEQIYSDFFNGFPTNDPFAFDEALATNKIIGALAPYYAQTLQQFLRGIRLRGARSEEDSKKLLEELQSGTDLFTGRSKRLLDVAQQNAAEGYAQSGLYESGQRRRSQGLLAVEKGQEVNNFLQGQERKKLNTQESLRRTLEDLVLERSQKERELAGAQQSDVNVALENARRSGNIESALNLIEQTGPAPGENYTDFLNRRTGTFSQFL